MAKKHGALPMALCSLLVACDAAPGPDMRPGADCLACHVAGGSGPVFSAAGTVFDDLGNGVAGATVAISDSAQHQFTATTSASGNFYLSESLTPPLQVTIAKGSSSVRMDDAESGACNACHGGGQAGAIKLK